MRGRAARSAPRRARARCLSNAPLSSSAPRTSTGALPRPASGAPPASRSSRERWLDCSDSRGPPRAPAPGTVSLSSSSRFPLKPMHRSLVPVTFPPGRARLATRPSPTGSLAAAKTIGMVVVAAWRPGRWRILGHDNVRLEPDQLGRERREPLVPPLSLAALDDEVLALQVAELLQPLPEGHEGQDVGVDGSQKPDRGDFRRRLPPATAAARTPPAARAQPRPRPPRTPGGSGGSRGAPSAAPPWAASSHRGGTLSRPVGR